MTPVPARWAAARRAASRPAAAIGLGTAAVFLLFLVCLLVQTGRRMSLPLDDPFIYFQYAKQLARGQVLAYGPGEAPTTGATSPLYLLLLTVGVLLQFDGMGLAGFAVVLGAVLLAGTAVQARRLAMALGTPLDGALAAALVLLGGPFVWGALSGMEIGLFAFLLLGTLAALAEEGVAPPGGPRRTAVWGALLGAVRPEGLGLALALSAVLVAGARRTGPGRAKALAMALAPAAAGLLPFLVYLALTGSVRTTGMQAKSLLFGPDLSLAQAVRLVLWNFASVWGGLFGGAPGRLVNLYAYEGTTRPLAFAPLAGALFAIGMVRAFGHEQGARRLAAGLGVAWLVLGVLATATIVEHDAHHGRYQQPIYPLVTVLVAVGAGQAAAWARAASESLGRVAARAIAAWLLLWGAVTTGFFALAYGDHANDIDKLQVSLSRQLAESLPPGARLAVNDAGALAYLSGRPVVDLVGLVTPGLAEPWRHGSGSLWEALEAMPPALRPTHFAIFPNWFRFGDLGTLDRIRAFALMSPSITDAEKVLYGADWSLAGSGDQPAEWAAPPDAAGMEVVDGLDVADLASEAAHGLRLVMRERDGYQPSFVFDHLAPAPPGAPEGAAGPRIVDGGRLVNDRVSFTLRGRSGRAARVLCRTVAGVRQRFAVHADGADAGAVQVWVEGPRQWAIAELPPVPAAAMEDGAVRLELICRREDLGRSPVLLFHVWLLQAR